MLLVNWSTAKRSNFKIFPFLIFFWVHLKRFSAWKDTVLFLCMHTSHWTVSASACQFSSIWVLELMFYRICGWLGYMPFMPETTVDYSIILFCRTECSFRRPFLIWSEVLMGFLFLCLFKYHYSFIIPNCNYFREITIISVKDTFIHFKCVFEWYEFQNNVPSFVQ